MLFIGFICVLLSANWLVVIAFQLLNFYILQKDIAAENKSVSILEQGDDYLNLLLKYLMDQQVDQMCNLIFIAMSLYMLAVTIQGNYKIGFRFAIPTFFPMRQNETQFASFMFNILILNCCSLAITQYCADKFVYYTYHSTIYKLTLLFKYSDFMFYMTENYVIGLIMFVSSIMMILINVFKGNYRLEYSELEKKYKKKEKKKG